MFKSLVIYRIAQGWASELQASELVRKDRKASISYVQRKLLIGYNRAARLLESMEKAGVVSRMDSSGARTVLDGAPA
ncbi:hypothetical protein DBR23_05910 [Acidovorax sp. HMWF018]|nr:hypothetical protein [Burkholderiales bacterium]PTT41481.1 hypothetical protein DBR23_05910 [Acidovorax sp. HMWF018]